MPLPIVDRRADALRRRAIELAQEARWEADKGRRRFLLDKARSAVAAADATAPEPPPQPEIFRSASMMPTRRAAGAQTRVSGR
jgi:hypothetical protein